MKQKLLRLSLLSMLAVLFSTVASAQKSTDFKDFAAILNNAEASLLTADEKVQGTEVNFGIAVDENGAAVRVAADADNAIATVSGKYHSEHGITNSVVSVNVSGPVKVTIGNCQYGNAPAIKNGSETVAQLDKATNCYHQNTTANVTEGYYKGESAATLTITGAGYLPYVAVKAVSLSDIPNDAKVAYAAGEGQGLLPEAKSIEIGTQITLPANTTLYAEGKTFTGWSDGSNVYKPGETLKVEADVTLTAQFADNTVALTDRTEPLSLTWQLGEGNGAGPVNYQGKAGWLVTQATIGGQVIDVKMDIDGTNGKANNVGRGDKWAQVNSGTKFIVPSAKGAVIEMEAYGDISTTTINGAKDYTEGKVISTTVNSTAETAEIVVGNGAYYSYVTVTLPVASADEWSFRDFGVDLVNILTDEQRVEKQAVEIGIKVAEDGTVSQVPYGSEGANANLKGTYWNDHGWTSTEATVKVEGPVQIDLGNCNYGSGDIVVKDAGGNVVATGSMSSGNGCWNANNAGNVVSVKYTGEATTLTITYGSYLPYIGVKAIEATAVEVSYSLGGADCQGTELPTGGTYAAGDQYTIPAKNFTLYKEGYTLTAWTDGTNEYATGATITLPANDLALTPVFTANTVKLSDRTEPVTLKFDFQRQNGAPAVQWEGQTGLVWVTQAEVNGQTIDVKADLSTSPGKFANKNWTDWAQLNGGTTFTIPSAKGAVVSIESYSATTTTTIDGQTDYTASGNTVTYSIANTAETIDIVIGDGSYFRYIQTVLPVVEQTGGQSFSNAAANIIWDLNDAADYPTPNTLEPEGAFTLTTVNVGDFTITVDAPSAGANAGIKMLKLQPDGGDNTTVEFIAKPTKGLTFTPTKVSAKVARFGTDGGTLNVSVKNAEGKEVALATGLIPARNNKDQAGDAKGTEQNYTTEFSLDVPADLATSESFTLVVTEEGLATNKQWGIGDVRFIGTVDGTTEDVEKFTFTATASPEKGGSVNVYPKGEEFDQGTELKLTATKNFGYQFVNWTDGDGNVLSDKEVFNYTVNANAELTANFAEVQTYELKYAVEGGANLYQVQPTPAPTVVGGKNMYEEGTTVTLTASSNAIVTFTNWSDGTSSSEMKLTMDKDYDLTASYTAADYIVGWDFYKPGNNGRVADFHSTADNEATALILIDNDGNQQGWLDKSTEGAGGYESMAGAAVNWKKLGQYHYQTKINAKDFTNIKVKSQLLCNYNAYSHVTLDYSLDGTNWTTVAETNMESVKVVYDLDVTLPAAADHAESLYLRWMPDLTSAITGTNAPDNDGTAIANIYVLADAAIYDDGTAPALVSTVPAEGANNASANGRVVLTFDEKVKLTDGAKATLNGEELQLTASGKTVIAEYKNLTYSTAYTFVLAANSVADLAGNTLAESVTVNFTTMTKPTVAKDRYDFIVPTDGTFKEALAAAAARSDKSKRFRIFVKKGDYIIPANESNMVTGNDGKQYADPKTSFNTPNVSIIGEDMEATTIANTMPNDLSANPDAGKGGQANPLEGIRTSGVLYLTSGATDTYFQDITLKTNTPDATGRNVVLVDGSNRTVCKNVTLWAYQDTYVSDRTQSTYYFEGGVLRGRTDFLCGSGDVFYNGVTLQMCEKGGYIAVPRDNAKYGYVFKDCTIKGETSDVNGNYSLGRPWTAGAEVYFIDTKMEAIPSAAGWAEMSGGSCTRMCEYNSMSASGTPIDLSGRATQLGGKPNNPVLTAEEAAEIGNMSNMFGDWDPRQLTEQAPVPTNVVLSGNTLTWDDSDYVLCWAVCQNGDVIDFTTEPTYTIPSAAKRNAAGTSTWTVRAANEMGGLSEAATASVSTGIEEVAAEGEAQTTYYYNMAGSRVSNSEKGVLIKVQTNKDGKKVVSKTIVK